MTPLRVLVDSVLRATFVDWVDMLLLTAVIYRVLVIMRGTRGVQSLLGLLLVGVLYLVSGAAGMSAVHWVLDNIVVYVVIVMLILFQEDIRRVLARAGGTFFARSSGTSPSGARVIEEVVKACFSLAHRRIGALVVIQRQGSLDAYSEGGHPLDAEVSAELLQALFHPTSPLHDGAVVISHGRVLAAGVFLPISLSKELSRALGTRHRAALGLSEETDGLCLVVSEERGTVSLVSRGQITPVADANDLRHLLGEKLVEAPPPTAPEPAGA